MNVEIINVGTELLLGEIVNTNATYLQKMCRELGFNVYHQSVVGDNPERLLDCFRIAFDRGADCVITTGGLGPTNDDLTKELSAQYLGVEMEYNEEEAKKVYGKCSFLGHSETIAHSNYKQAYFPKNCYILENEVGTANGCIISQGHKMIINLPGPPKEMRYVVDHVLKPYLMQYQQDRIYTYEYITMFIGESTLADVLKDIIDSQDEVTIALYAGEEIVRVRLAVKAQSQQIANQKMADTRKAIEERISPYIIKENNMKDALMTIMVPYSIEYKGDFRLHDDFLDGQFKSDHPKMKLRIETIKENYGEVIYLYINEELQLQLPLLKEANISYDKAQYRIITVLYKYLKNNPNYK